MKLHLQLSLSFVLDVYKLLGLRSGWYDLWIYRLWVRSSSVIVDGSYPFLKLGSWPLFGHGFLTTIFPLKIKNYINKKLWELKNYLGIYDFSNFNRQNRPQLIIESTTYICRWEDGKFLCMKLKTFCLTRSPIIRQWYEMGFWYQTTNQASAVWNGWRG